MVRGVHAGRIVDGVGVEPSAGQGIFDAAELSETQIGAFADHLGAQLGAAHAHRVVGAVAGVEIALRDCLDEGADAAEEQQIGLGR